MGGLSIAARKAPLGVRGWVAFGRFKCAEAPNACVVAPNTCEVVKYIYSEAYITYILSTNTTEVAPGTYSPATSILFEPI